MSFIRKSKHLLLACALVAAPSGVIAQNSIDDQANKVAEEAEDLQRASNQLSQTVAENQNAVRDAEDRSSSSRDHDDGDDDGDSGRWGLLGLLGLAGLLGLKRQNRDHDYDRDRVNRAGTNDRR